MTFIVWPLYSPRGAAGDGDDRKDEGDGSERGRPFSMLWMSDAFRARPPSGFTGRLRQSSVQLAA